MGGRLRLRLRGRTIGGPPSNTTARPVSFRIQLWSEADGKLSGVAEALLEKEKMLED